MALLVSLLLVALLMAALPASAEWDALEDPEVTAMLCEFRSVDFDRQADRDTL
jgi:hypothetical protein